MSVNLPIDYSVVIHRTKMDIIEHHDTNQLIYMPLKHLQLNRNEKSGDMNLVYWWMVLCYRHVVPRRRSNMSSHHAIPPMPFQHGRSPTCHSTNTVPQIPFQRAIPPNRPIHVPRYLNFDAPGVVGFLLYTS